MIHSQVESWIVKPFEAIEFVKRRGVVLASGKGGVPSLAEAVAGEPIRGSWWAHPKGKAIFRALERVSDSPDVRCFKLVGGKVTFVHRRCWAALVRLAAEIGKESLAEVRQEHTATGAHRNVVTPFPQWVPRDLAAEAKRLSLADARASLGDALRECGHGRASKKR